MQFCNFFKFICLPNAPVAPLHNCFTAVGNMCWNVFTSVCVLQNEFIRYIAWIQCQISKIGWRVVLPAVAGIAPKKLAFKFYEGSLSEVALFDQWASTAFPEIQLWTKPPEVVSQYQHCENFLTLSVEEKENLENVCRLWVPQTSPGGFPANGVPLKRCYWLCGTNLR